MGNLNETEKWEENIYQLETSDPVLGGADGISNRAPRQLANRTKWLKKKTEEAAQSLAEHVRSRNHPDATLTAKGFTQLSSATNSTSETLAATPKAVKAAYDLAAGKAPVSHTHPWSQITGVPAASLTAKGTVQLSSAINSTSETLAATPKAVKAAYDLAAGKAPASHTHPWSQITGVPAASLTAKGTVQLSSATDSQSETEAATPKAVKIAYDLARGKYTAQDATTTRKGIVQLSSAINSTSETLAATPKAVKAAYDLAAGKAPASHTHPWSQITGVPAASLTAKGTVQLSSATDSQSETEAATPKAVKAAYDLAAGKAPVSHTHPWSQITGVPAASLTAKGTVQLSSAINSTSEILAATPKAVKAAYDLANGKQPADATLTALAGLATAADRLPYFTGADRAALATLTAIGRAIIAKGSIKDVLNYLGLGEGSALPVGVPVPWPTATPPAGWLKCDGRAFTKEQYPVLARVYPTLRLPDLRGEFIRGWDDGRKIDEGRKLLSWQKGTLVGGHDDNDSSLDISYMSNGNNIDYGGDKVFAGNYRSDYLWYVILGGTNSRAKAELNGAFFNITRPRNIAFNYIVRAA
ncbi:phage tail protein [Escherichia coli]|uniref:phage tail protein n=3 Tax=Enterobacteriaceae TaxID=543 RepID=UPI000BE15D10|nr:tail fiber protein [Escherichia coli]